MATDIIARGMASKAAKAAQDALDELSMVVEGTMNAAGTEFTDLGGNVVTPDTETVYQDVNTYVYYRWNGTSYYAVSDPRGVVRYTAQTLTTEEQAQARTNIGASDVTNLENGEGTNAIQEKMADSTVNFTGRNPNAEALDPTISTTINTGASGSQSSAFGKNTMALATASFTNGNKTLAKGEESHAEGYQSVTLGDGSHAEGSRTTAYGSQSHAEGIETIALGNDSHAEGEGTRALGINSHSEGYYTQAYGNSSHAEGANTVANAVTAHTEGVSNYVGVKQSGDPSSGTDTPSTQPSGYIPDKGEGSHAEGYDNFVYGVGSHAEGSQNVVNGDFAHAEGIQTTASGTGSHSGGYRTTATYNYQAVVGKFNDNKSTTLFEVGNGTANNARSNAFEVHADGSAKVGLMGNDDLSVATKQYVDNNVVANPTTTGTETAITSLQIGNTKYVVGGSGGGIVEKTWAELKALRDAGQLVPGSFYRITDYVCTTTQYNTSAVNHQFDIIVLALDESHLSEEAWAAHHFGDTYFANSKLELWKLWYCLDNDANRFAWADTKGVVVNNIIYVRTPHLDNSSGTYPYAWFNGHTSLGVGQVYTDTENPTTDTRAYYSSTGGTSYTISSIHEEAGKGIIYRMIDEFNNEAPFDFKNILITASCGSVISITNGYCFSGKSAEDGSMTGKYYSNCIKFYKTEYTYDRYIIPSNFIGARISSSGWPYVFDNIIEPNCLTCFIGAGSSSVGASCRDNYIDNSCENVVLSYRNTASRNIIGEKCSSIVTDSTTKIGENCQNINLNENSSNVIGFYCRNITFSENCHGNTVGNNCQNINFGYRCINNSIGNGCSSITITNTDNTRDNTDNVFDDDCSGIYLKGLSQYNVFGARCSGIYGGIGFKYVNIGSDCNTIIFGDSTSSTTNYVQNVVVGSLCYYLDIKCTADTGASASNYLQTIVVDDMVWGTYSSHLILDVPDRALRTITKYTMANAQEIIVGGSN